jgi:hypothetical protein
MEVSTDPLRWKFLCPREDPNDPKYLKRAVDEREFRAEKTNVTRLDFLPDGRIKRVDFKTAHDLEAGLADLKSPPDQAPGAQAGPTGNETPTASKVDVVQDAVAAADPPYGTPTKNIDPAPNDPKTEQPTRAVDPDKVQFRFFVVEDLSRRVIEALGSKFDLDPSFFREHINDYAWYNIRDRFAEARKLRVVAEQQPWVQLRWVRPRYFVNQDSYQAARVEANTFNIIRRPDEDYNNGALLDDEDATVALTRTRASFWTGKINGEDIGEYILHDKCHV